ARSAGALPVPVRPRVVAGGDRGVVVADHGDGGLRRAGVRQCGMGRGGGSIGGGGRIGGIARGTGGGGGGAGGGAGGGIAGVGGRWRTRVARWRLAFAVGARRGREPRDEQRGSRHPMDRRAPRSPGAGPDAAHRHRHPHNVGLNTIAHTVDTCSRTFARFTSVTRRRARSTSTGSASGEDDSFASAIPARRPTTAPSAIEPNTPTNPHVSHSDNLQPMIAIIPIPANSVTIAAGPKTRWPRWPACRAKRVAAAGSRSVASRAFSSVSVIRPPTHTIAAPACRNLKSAYQLNMFA